MQRDNTYVKVIMNKQAKENILNIEQQISAAEIKVKQLKEEFLKEQERTVQLLGEPYSSRNRANSVRESFERLDVLLELLTTESYHLADLYELSVLKFRTVH